MAVGSLFMPDAPDSDVTRINPTAVLQSTNHLLDDPEGLAKFYEENGYLLLRNVLERESIAQARREMFAVMERHGLIGPGATEPVWTGKPFAGGLEESDEFAGISRRLLEHPDNAVVMAKILGEPACTVPIVQYRTYPPGSPQSSIHQDGFYSPGIQDYRPVWITLTDCPRQFGGLAIAVGQNRRGYMHNLAKAPASPIPEGVIPDETWATTDYQPGDVLVIHPYAPHASLPNRTNLCRVTFDTRVQSAAYPRVIAGTVADFTADSITMQTRDGLSRKFRVDNETFIRIITPHQRIPYAEYVETVKQGMNLVVAFDGDHAEMLRKAAEG